MEVPKLRLVETEEEQELPNNVIQLRRSLGYAAVIQSLPDNVFLLRDRTPEPPEAA